MKTNKPPVERFHEKYIPEPNSGCWLWVSCVQDEGYGLFWNGKRSVVAHRFSYERFVGPILEGLHIDHLCSVRSCVNPDHLEAVTPAENARRSEGVSTLNARKTHCFRGHEFTEHNIYRPPNKAKRECRKCRETAGKIRRLKNERP